MLKEMKTKLNILTITALFYVAVLSALIPIIHGVLYAPFYVLTFALIVIIIIKLEKL